MGFGNPISYGQVVQLEDTYGLGPYAARLEGSNPSLPTSVPLIINKTATRRFFGRTNALLALYPGTIVNRLRNAEDAIAAMTNSGIDAAII